MYKRYIVGLAILVSTVLSDQLSKMYVLMLYELHGIIEISPFCSLVQVWNSGMSFGMFGSYEKSNVVFIVITTLAVCVLMFLFFRARRMSSAISLCLISGGTLGNLIDRFLFGAVHDFIALHIGELYWPAFNAADVYIVLGVGLFLLQKADTYKSRFSIEN
ncbi:signal peptidase II [Anaplasma bovis]|uniref:signal peptidase II n=1 Tax=Anaplasma bovis TaxID=186733 RepID=UPI002FF2CB6C